MNGAVDSDLGVSAILWMFGGAAAGLLLAPLAGWLWRAPGRDGFPMDLCVFMLVFGVAARTGALRLARAARQFHRASQEATGVLVEFVAKKSTYDSKKRRNVQTRHPRVEFTAADGGQHSLVGLGGSLSQRQVGSAVTVRYRADQPAAAAVADFQSQWGAAWAFGISGGAALVALGMGRGLVADPVRPQIPGAANGRSRGFWLMRVSAGLVSGVKPPSA